MHRQPCPPFANNTHNSSSMRQQYAAGTTCFPGRLGTAPHSGITPRHHHKATNPACCLPCRPPAQPRGGGIRPHHTSTPHHTAKHLWSGRRCHRRRLRHHEHPHVAATHRCSAAAALAPAPRCGVCCVTGGPAQRSPPRGPHSAHTQHGRAALGPDPHTAHTGAAHAARRFTAWALPPPYCRRTRAGWARRLSAARYAAWAVVPCPSLSHS